MHSSATAQILDHSIDHARFGVRFHNGEVGHDTLQQRHQRLLTAQGFNHDSAELKKLRRNITKSSIKYQQYRVGAVMAPFLALFGLTIAKVAAEESMPQIYLMLVVVAGFAYVVWRDYPRGLAREHAQKGRPDSRRLRSVDIRRLGRERGQRDRMVEPNSYDVV